MVRFALSGAALLAVLVVVARSAAEETLAPVYSLPEDGTWVEYEWRATGTGKEDRKGILRISSVGRQTVKGAAHRWVELKLLFRQGEQTRCRIRKLLIDEKAFPVRGSLRRHIAAGYALDRTGGPVLRLSARSLDHVIGMGMQGGEKILADGGDKVKIDTPLGAFATRRVRPEGKDGKRSVHYAAWLTAKVPFGWAQFEVKDAPDNRRPRTVFSARAVRTGTGAKSEVDHSQAPASPPRPRAGTADR